VLRFRRHRAVGLLSARSALASRNLGRRKRCAPSSSGRLRGVAMQHQLSNVNASTTIGRVKSSPTANHALGKIARFAEAETTCGMQFKQARNFSNAKPETRESIRRVETALRAAQRSVPHASSGVGCSDRQLSTQTPSAPPVRAQFLSKSRVVALISVALVLPSLVGVAFWLSVHSPLAHQYIPSPVLTAPAFLEATAGETILLPIALDGTDGVPAHSTIAIAGLPQGSTLSNGRPYGETAWNLEQDEIGDLHLVLPNSGRSGQTYIPAHRARCYSRRRCRDPPAGCDRLTSFFAAKQ